MASFPKANVLRFSNPGDRETTPSGSFGSSPGVLFREANPGGKQSNNQAQRCVARSLGKRSATRQSFIKISGVLKSDKRMSGYAASRLTQPTLARRRRAVVKQSTTRGFALLTPAYAGRNFK
jgi:hypothetical protein